MSYTTSNSIATCKVPFENVNDLLDSIIFYLKDNRQEIQDGLLTNFWQSYCDENESDDVNFDTLKGLLSNYLKMESPNNLEILRDSEDSECYDSDVFEFLVNHITYLQTSEFMEVIHHTEDSRDGHSQDVCYYDLGGGYYTAEELASIQNKSISDQIQEDIRSYASAIDDEGIFFTQEVLDTLCQIVVDRMIKE